MSLGCLYLALLAVRVHCDESYDDCPPQELEPFVIEDCPNRQCHLNKGGVTISPLADKIINRVSECDGCDLPIGTANGINLQQTVIYVTSTNGVTEGDCTDSSNPCSIEYVFDDAFLIQDYTEIQFDPAPPVPYPRMHIVIDKYVRLMGNGVHFHDTVHFEFALLGKTLAEGHEVTIGLRDFSFAHYWEPSVRFVLNNIEIGSLGHLIAGINNCRFQAFNSRAIEAVFENTTTQCTLSDECKSDCSTQFISIEVLCCEFIDNVRNVHPYDNYGGVVLIDNRDQLIPVGLNVFNSTFINTTMWTNNPNILTAAGGCIAAFNLYAVGITNSIFQDSRITITGGDIFGAALYIVNKQECDASAAVVIKGSTFHHSTIGLLTCCKCTGAGAAIYLFRQGNTIILNNHFLGNIINSVSHATGFDIALYEARDVWVCGCHFHQQLFDLDNNVTCSTYPRVISGGSIFYDTRNDAKCCVETIHLSVLNSEFYGSERINGSLCPGAPDGCNETSWIYGGAIFAVSDTLDQDLFIEVYNVNFYSIGADVGGAIMITAIPPNEDEVTGDMVDNIKTHVLLENLYFDGCSAALYGGAIVISPGILEDANQVPIGINSKLFNVYMKNIININNFYPTTSFVVSSAVLGICDFVALNNEAGGGVLFLLQTETTISGTFNISNTTTVYVEPTVPSLGGIYISGEYSRFVILQNATVFIKALGSPVSEHGWGLTVDVTAAKVGFQILNNPGETIINRVQSNGNCALNSYVIFNDTPGNTCDAEGLMACSSSDPSIGCIHYCVCPGSGDPFCGSCIPPTPTASPAPTMTPAPTETPSASPSPPPSMTPVPTMSPAPSASASSTPMASPTMSPVPPPSSSPSPTQTDVPSEIFPLTTIMMTDSSFLVPQPDDTVKLNEILHILVSTTMSGGLLTHISIEACNYGTSTGNPDEYCILIPTSNYSITYWPGMTNQYGITTQPITWPAGHPVTDLYLVIEAQYEIPGSLSGGAPMSFKRHSTIKLASANGTGNAGRSVFTLNRALLAGAVIAGTAVMNII